MARHSKKKEAFSEVEIDFYNHKFAELVEQFNIGAFGNYHYLNVEEYFRILFERQGQLRLQEHGKEHYFDGHYNAIVRRIKRNYGKKDWWIVTDTLDGVWGFQNDPFAIVSPVTYIGATRSLYNRKKNELGEDIGADRTRLGNARYLFAFTIDLDNVYVKNMKYLTLYIQKGHIPQPTMITCSGRGLHLYYCLEKPVSIRIEQVEILNRMKILLTMLVWHYNLTCQKPTVEFHDINQGYRIPESKTKFGRYVHTYALDGEVRYYTIRELNEYVKNMYKARPDFFKVQKSQYKPLEEVVLKFIEVGFRKSKLSNSELQQLETFTRLPAHWSLETAKRKFGTEWYEYVKANGSKDWSNYSKNFYDWWLRKLRFEHEVTIGHRYWCLYVLACWAYNCHIPFEQLHADAMSLMNDFNLLIDKDNGMREAFTRKDMEDALKIYKERTKLGKVVRLGRARTERTTGISIEGNKRNFRTRQQHAYFRIEQQRIKHDPLSGGDGIDWREGNGRPSKAQVVAEWKEAHPGLENKSLCARECGLDLKTVRKWWNRESRKEIVDCSPAFRRGSSQCTLHHCIFYVFCFFCFLCFFC